MSASSRKNGVLEKLPRAIAYMKKAGPAANKVDAEEVEGNDALTRRIESIFREHFKAIPKAKGLKKLKKDQKALWDWLQAHPMEKFPETGGLYVVFGMLTYIDYIYDR